MHWPGSQIQPLYPNGFVALVQPVVRSNSVGVLPPIAAVDHWGLHFSRRPRLQAVGHTALSKQLHPIVSIGSSRDPFLRWVYQLHPNLSEFSRSLTTGLDQLAQQGSGWGPAS